MKIINIELEIISITANKGVNGHWSLCQFFYKAFHLSSPLFFTPENRGLTPHPN